MKKIIYILLFTIIIPHLSQAQSLDEIYRDIVKAENEGYLPLYVKNRKAPDFLNEDIKAATQISTTVKSNTAPISLVDKRQSEEQKRLDEDLKWRNTISAIKLNQITPVELNIVESKVEKNDPKATEIYAWMLARGVGIEQNLVKAFNMYQRAAFLNIPDADKNAVVVYHTMTSDQRSQVKTPNIIIEENNS